MNYNETMDFDCIELCNTLNSLPGIETFESCCGHGKTPYHIWFTTKDLDSLYVPTISCYRMYCGCLGWEIKVCHNESTERVCFLLEGPIDYKNDLINIIQTIKHFQKIIIKKLDKFVEDYED